MLLAIDIGNSNIVLGISEGETWRFHWRMETQVAVPSSKYELDIRNFLLENSIPIDGIGRSILSSVVPQLTDSLLEAVRAIFGHSPLVVQPEIYDKLPIQTANPYEMGTDLMANALAAFEKYRHTVLVVDFGTALTFTTVSKTGKILGVAITLGLKTAVMALSVHTAQLPDVSLQLPTSALGKDTPHAIRAGTLLGYVGLVRELVGQIKAEVGEDCKVIATGGLVNILQPTHILFDSIEPMLTLNGLRKMASYCNL